MLAPKHDVSKTVFQVERLSTFSDGVFAISITLLIIEFKVPELADIKSFSDHSLWIYLWNNMAFKFIGFLISFGIVGHYWSVHHRIFGYVNKYTSSLLWINLVFLFCVVLLPFSSGLVGEYASNREMNLPYVIYAVNICITGLVNCWLWLYISNPKRELLTHKISASRIRLGVYRSLVIPIVFIISLLLSYVMPVIAHFFIPMTIPVILHYGMRELEQRANRDELPVVIESSQGQPV